MFKRIFLFLLTNIAIIVVINIVLFVLSSVFGINITAYGFDYVSIFLFALVVWFTWSFISLAISKWMAKKAYGVQVLNKEELHGFDPKMRIVFDVVEDLSERHHIKMPEVGYYESSDPNAFATGPSKNNSLVAVSTGLLHSMDKDEIEWVIGHEMAHVLNGDMVTMTLLQWVLNTFVVFIARVVANIADKFLSGDEESSGPSWVYFVVSIVMEILLGILASMIAMWFSRHREYRADAWSAMFLGKQKMIKSLQALKKMQSLAMGDDEKLASMKISTRKRWWIMALFSSHPDLDDRIQALENMRV